MEEALKYIGLGLLLLVITWYYTRWLFSIEKSLRMQAAQTKLLIQLAKNAGVPQTEIDEIQAPVKTDIE